MTMKRAIIAVILAASASNAWAQSTPNFSYGQVPTAGQWNGAFSAKHDVWTTMAGLFARINSSTVGPFTSVKLPSFTTATLPTCNTSYQDTMAVASDATAPTYRGALTGGGTVRIPVYCDGVAWSSH